MWIARAVSTFVMCKAKRTGKLAFNQTNIIETKRAKQQQQKTENQIHAIIFSALCVVQQNDRQQISILNCVSTFATAHSYRKRFSVAICVCDSQNDKFPQIKGSQRNIATQLWFYHGMCYRTFHTQPHVVGNNRDKNEWRSFPFVVEFSCCAFLNWNYT